MQEVPIKLYRTPDRLMVAAPMPGLLPEDVEIEVTEDNHLVLHGALSRPRQQRRTRRPARHFVGHAAEYQPPQSATPVSGQGNQFAVGVLPWVALGCATRPR